MRVIVRSVPNFRFSAEGANYVENYKISLW